MKQRHYTILHVDDEPLARKAVQRCLQKQAHYTVLGARNWQDALEVLHFKSVDAVILDLHLPEINGFQVLRHLRQTHPYLPVLVLTGDENALFQCVELGCSGFLEKPYDAMVLRGQTDSLLHQRSNVALP